MPTDWMIDDEEHVVSAAIRRDADMLASAEAAFDALADGTADFADFVDPRDLAAQVKARRAR